MTTTTTIPQETTDHRIYVIRHQKVMLDRDLAQLYGVETKQLKRQVRRNIERFPEDFMFVLNNEEFKNWRSAFVTSNIGDKTSLRYAPMAFTEQGIAMLPSILTSNRAIQVNIQIIRMFIQVREITSCKSNPVAETEEIEKTLFNKVKTIEPVFTSLDELIRKNAASNSMKE